jgi:hypothetical protein
MQDTISLIVKGNKFQAARAAADLGIPMAFVRETKHNETIGRVHSAWHHEIVNWYNQDVGNFAPFPIGTLLHYSFKE